MEKIMRQRIEEIRKIKREHDLSNEVILDVVYAYGKNISGKTLQKILAEGSEYKNFRYQSILDVHEALMDRFGNSDEPNDITALKCIIEAKNHELDRVLMEFEEREREFDRKMELCDQRKDAYEKTISILETQLQRQSEIISRLLEIKPRGGETS